MSNAAAKLDPDRLDPLAGTVTRIDGALVAVRASGSVYEARRAKSCLVAPEVGDRVMIAASATGPAWVLAVLEGDPASATTSLEVPGTLRIEAESVAIRASEGASVTTPGRIGLLGGELDVKALRSRIGLSELTATVTKAVIDAGHLRTVAETVEAVAERLVQRSTRFYRFVEELERVRAGRMDVDAGKSLRMHAENSIVTAETLVKLDGNHIHMG
jgi:hypothetical protein